MQHSDVVNKWSIL